MEDLQLKLIGAVFLPTKSMWITKFFNLSCLTFWGTLLIQTITEDGAPLAVLSWAEIA